MKAALRFLRSLRFAYEGIKYALSSQPNMKIHFFTAFVVLASALFFRLPRTDVLFILLAITLVIVTELINTAVEKAVDLAMPDRHPLAKIAKDTAAAAVLVTAAFAVAVGLVVFYGPVAAWLSHTRGTMEDPVTEASVWLYLLLVLLAVIVAQTRFSARSRMIKPSLLSAVAFSLASLIALTSGRALPGLLSYLLAALFVVILFRRKSRTAPGLLFGAALGTAITLLAFNMSELVSLIR